MSVKRLEKLLNLNDDGELADIIRHARDMGELVQMLQMSLSEQAAASVVAANIRDDGELVVLVTSPAWASRLRFETDTLLAAARRAGADVSCCSIRVSRDVTG